MSPQPGAFRLAASSNGELHLVSDLPQRVSISKVLWDALAAGAHPHARIEPSGQPTDTAGWLDLVIETAECTFRYRHEEWDEAHDHYVCALVSRTDAPKVCTCARINVDSMTSQGVHNELVPGLRDPNCLVHKPNNRPGFSWPRGV